jgi:16S rRNA (cytidine1402-2'-O)-methyltransferase
VSGFSCPHFVFYGFLASKAGERRKALEALAPMPYTLVFYEAPHRVLETIADLAQVFGGARTIVIARELTKLFESIHACRLDLAGDWLNADANRLKGEFVLIVEGARDGAAPDIAEVERTLSILLEELPVKQAAALAARITGARKNEMYALALEMKNRDE